MVCLPFSRMMSSKSKRRRASSVSPDNAGSISTNMGSITSGQPSRINERVPSKSSRTWLMWGLGTKAGLNSTKPANGATDCIAPGQLKTVRGEKQLWAWGALQPRKRTRNKAELHRYTVASLHRRENEQPRREDANGEGEGDVLNRWWSLDPVRPIVHGFEGCQGWLGK